MTVNPWKLQQWSRSAAYAGWFVLAVVLTVTVLDVRGPLTEFLATSNRAAGNVEKASATYTEQLTSERNRKAIDAGIAVGASVQATVRLLNTQTIPRLNEAIDRLGATAEQSRELLANMDDRINGQDGVLLAVRNVAARFETTPEKVNAAIVTLATAGQLTMEAANKLIADPAWQTVLANAASVSAEAASAARNVEAATDALPGIATELQGSAANVKDITALIEKFLAEQSKGSKVILALRIVGAVLPLLQLR